MNINLFQGKTCIIFDFDGVICDSVDIKTEAFLALYTGFDASILTEIKNYHLANGGISRYKKIKFFEENILGRNLSNSQLLNLVDKFSENVIQNVIRANYISGAYEFLEIAQNKFKIYLCTATPQFEIEIILAEKHIDNYFDAVYGSPDDKFILFNRIMIEHNVKAQEIIYFGDSLSDLDVAKYYGIDFIGISTNERYFPSGTIVYNDFNEIIIN